MCCMFYVYVLKLGSNLAVAKYTLSAFNYNCMYELY